VLIDAARNLMPEDEWLHVLFVGQGPLEQSLRERASQSGFPDRFHFAGWRDDVPELLAAGTCLVVPSLWEGMANVVLEAMAAGTPVVASHVEGMDELVQHERTGLLVPPGSAEDLSRAIMRLLNNPELAAAMAKTAQDSIIKEFKLEAVASAYDRLYESLLSD
jgi:glycosyltransferase involved in cell wall biosynthesis